jgi:hydroxyethylthiazole kinase-like uncharacterized protein yjeF
MLPLLTREAVRAIDRDAIDRLGVPGLTLMEHAGRGAFQVLRARFAACLERVLVVCGPGQNGGDGFVVARHLLWSGFRPRVALGCDAAQVTGDARANLERLRGLGVVPERTRSAAELHAFGEAATLVIDALFGTGLTRPLEGSYAELVVAMESLPAPRVALDLPSGVDANTGAVLGVAPRVALTLSFAALKRGLYQHPGAALAGEVVCVPIGVPGPDSASVGLLEPSDVASWLPRRAADVHKGDAGRVLVVAGSPGHTGAALLAGLGAQRAGAGLVTLAPRSAARAALDAKVLELMTVAVAAEPALAAAELLELGASCDALVVGPGLGTDPDGQALARSLARALPRPTVLDADALGAHAGQLDTLRNAAGPRVLTPHPGEAARLLGWTVARVQADRYAAASELAAQSGAVCVLKGAGSLVAAPDGRLAVCARGTPALASGGTGDVLAGVIGALLVALPAFEAAAAGVYLHALAGELAARSDRGLLARDVADRLPEALERCRLA